MNIFIFRKVKRMAQKYIEGDIVMYGNKVMVVKENAPDVVASIIFAPSVIAPVLLTAYDVWEPVSYTEPSK